MEIKAVGGGGWGWLQKKNHRHAEFMFTTVRCFYSLQAKREYLVII